MTNDLSGLRSRVGTGNRPDSGRRAIPPPQHTPAAAAGDKDALKSDSTTAAESRTPDTTRKTVSDSPQKRPAKIAHAETLIRQTVYLDDDADDLLEKVRSASRRRRVDANRSAVIRLALRQLAAQLTPTQIVDAIETAGKQAGPRRPGRQMI